MPVRTAPPGGPLAHRNVRATGPPPIRREPTQVAGRCNPGTYYLRGRRQQVGVLCPRRPGLRPSTAVVGTCAGARGRHDLELLMTAKNSTGLASARVQPPRARSTALHRAAAVGLGAVMLADGAGLAVLALAGRPPAVARVVELVLGSVVAVPGLLIAASGLRRHPVRLGVLLPDVVLAGALLSLGVAMPVFHQGETNYQTAEQQFVLVLAALGLGSAALVLSAATSPTAAEDGPVSFPGAVRNGVILIVGTILVAIAIGQLPGAKLTPPMWNWTSFLGITVPGMLVLVGRELVKQAERRRSRSGLSALLAVVLVESILVAGLFIMIYGSGANLTLGKNGFTTGFKGNSTGLELLIGAAVVLTLIRGPAKRAFASSTRPALGAVLLSKLAFAAAVIAFIYGERSIITGKPPVLTAGDAAVDALAILTTGLAILVIGRSLVAHQEVTVSTSCGTAAAPARRTAP